MSREGQSSTLGRSRRRHSPGGGQRVRLPARARPAGWVLPLTVRPPAGARGRRPSRVILRDYFCSVLAGPSPDTAASDVRVSLSVVLTAEPTFPHIKPTRYPRGGGSRKQYPGEECEPLPGAVGGPQCWVTSIPPEAGVQGPGRNGAGGTSDLGVCPKGFGAVLRPSCGARLLVRRGSRRRGSRRSRDGVCSGKQQPRGG